MIKRFKEYLLESSHNIRTRRLRGELNRAEREEMKRRLRHNIITFRFKKRDGTIRKAKGTLHPSYLPPLRGGGNIKPEHQMVYYDLDKEAWRSFRSFKFIKILNMRPIQDDDDENHHPDSEIERQARHPEDPERDAIDRRRDRHHADPEDENENDETEDTGNQDDARHSEERSRHDNDDTDNGDSDEERGEG